MLEAVLAADGDFEVIIVDGQSGDKTAAIAARFCRVLTSERGRAVQMNRGAEEAGGDVLLFLHADVVLPARAIIALEKAMQNPSIVGGNFDIVFEGEGWVPRVFTRFNRWRQAFGVFYGDSGIFVRREIFQQLGGYRALSLMEDYDFARRLVKTGRTVCLKEALRVSGRRWEEHGLLPTLVTWFVLHTLYLFGIPARYLAPFYPAIRRRGKSEETQESIRAEER